YKPSDGSTSSPMERPGTRRHGSSSPHDSAQWRVLAYETAMRMIEGHRLRRKESRMFYRRLAVLAAGAAVVLGACSSSGSPAASGGGGGGGGAGCTVGVSWNNFQQPRWAAHDKPNIQQTVEKAGGKYIDKDANLSNEQQATDIDTMI